MKKYCLTITSILVLVMGIISCSNEESKTQNQIAARPTVPIQNGEVQIGTQIWMTRNLNVTRYRNGDPIPQVTNATQWANLTTGAWCYYQNNTSNGIVYGKLYNWYVLNDPRGLAPTGWHVPTDAEWSTLINCLDPNADGGNILPNVAGGKMKATGTIQAGTGLWQYPNAEVTNASGFTGLPGGFRDVDGTFGDVRKFGYWWSSSEYFTMYAWYRNLNFDSSNATRSYNSMNYGFSVRCLKD